MTCLRARTVHLRIVRGYDTDQHPQLVVPSGWTQQQVLDYARAAHEPLGHTVTIAGRYGPNSWLPDPVGFVDYTTGERA